MLDQEPESDDSSDLVNVELRFKKRRPYSSKPKGKNAGSQNDIVDEILEEVL